MFAKNMCVSVRPGAHVSLPTGMCIARLHPHLSMPSVWKHPEGPCVKLFSGQCLDGNLGPQSS